jgi:hypothetical protein
MVMMALEGLERVLQVEETREMIRQDQIDSGEIEDEEDTRTPTLVSAALIEKARENHNSSAVTKRADRIWKQHFVSCALCKRSYSKHRAADATFCEECKCYVCSNCNCQVYHLSYQEELWAASEEKTEKKEEAKKSKNKKKKEKLKQKKAKQQQEEPTVEMGNAMNQPRGKTAEQSKSSSMSYTSEKSDKNNGKDLSADIQDSKGKDTDASKDDGAESKNTEDAPDPSEERNQQPPVDFVSYLQQTGSIIALAKLMDALEYGDDFDDELEDSELKMIRQQANLKQQATN